MYDIVPEWCAGDVIFNGVVYILKQVQMNSVGFFQPYLCNNSRICAIGTSRQNSRGNYRGASGSPRWASSVFIFNQLT